MIDSQRQRYQPKPENPNRHPLFVFRLPSVLDPVLPLAEVKTFIRSRC